VTVSVAMLDPATHATVQTQSLAGGMTLSATLTNSNPAVGTVPASASIAAGSDSVIVQFTPLSVGQTILSVPAPAGYTVPGDNSSLTVRVN
jgi:hypothetical protein